MTTESKQTRKNPLTTIGIAQEQAERLDALLKSRYPGMKRKEFLEGAIAYFERTGYDLQSDMMDFSGLERLTDRLEGAAKVIDEENKGRAELKQLFLDIQQKQLALPSSAEITAASEAKAKAETELEAARQELTALRQELDKYGRKIKDQDVDMTALRNKLAVAIAELERCSSGLFAKPSKTTIESLKS